MGLVFNLEKDTKNLIFMTAQIRPGMTVAAKFANVPKPPPQFRHSGRIRAQSSVP